MPKEGSHFICLSVILIDSVIKNRTFFHNYLRRTQIHSHIKNNILMLTHFLLKGHFSTANSNNTKMNL